MFIEINDDLPGMSAVYGELSEYAHFRKLAVYNTIVPEDGSRNINWTDAPRWRSEKELLVACAQLRELSMAARHGLRRFSRELIPYMDE